MKQICQKCGRGSFKVIDRSHSNRATIRRQKVNLQTKTIDKKRVLICARCIKTLAKTA